MTQYNNPTPVGVHLQAAYSDGKVGLVLIQRADNQQWALPGGYIETNIDSSAEDAAAREFFEETGIIACDGKLMYSTITPSGKLLIFSRSLDVFALSLGQWQANKEVLAIRVATEPEQLCYPAHTTAMELWFDKKDTWYV